MITLFGGLHFSNMPETPEYFATTAKVKLLDNLNAVDDNKISVHFPSAKLDTIDITGKDKYDEIIAKGESDPDFKNFQIAEIYFALSYIIPAINNESSGNGVTKATGFGDNRKENLSEFDIEKKIVRYRDNAQRILNRYIDPCDKPKIFSSSKIKMAAIG